MKQRSDWPLYSRWTWIIALLAAILLVLLWLTGRGPGSAIGCCSSAPVATAAPPAPVAAPVVATPVIHTAKWDGDKLTLEGVVADQATKKAIVDVAIAKYGAGNVVDKLTIDAGAKGALTVTLLGTVASDAVKTARGDEAKAFYPLATIDNQLSVAALVAAPAAKAEDVTCGDKIAVAATFATGSAKLTADAKKLMYAVVPCITGSFEVGGHTDNVGQAASNQTLSERRAQAILAYLVAKGVDAKMLSAKGYGDTAPIGDNASAQGRARNRRIEFKKI